MRRLVSVAIAAIVVLAGCTPIDDDKGGGHHGGHGHVPSEVDGVPTAHGTHKIKIDTEGFGHREALIHVPPALARTDFHHGRPKKPLPLVVGLHGGASDMGHFERRSGFDDIADDHGFLAAYPDGFAFTWNAGTCCGPARLADIDDVGFLTTLIDKLIDSGLADPRRVYVTGFSNGGGMAYKLACDGPGTIAAIAVVSAALAMTCHPDRPISTMVWHGTDDHNVPYNGGGHQELSDKPYPPVSDTVGFWRRLDEVAKLRMTFFHHGSTTCESGDGTHHTRVVLCTVEGGGHEWPEAASEQIWRFFSPITRPSD